MIIILFFYISKIINIKYILTLTGVPSNIENLNIVNAVLFTSELEISKYTTGIVGKFAGIEKIGYEMVYLRKI